MCGCASYVVWATSTCWRSVPKTRPSPCLNYRSEVSRRPTRDRARQDPHHHQHRSFTPNTLLLRLRLRLPHPLLRHHRAVMTIDEDGGDYHRWDAATRRNDDSDIRQHKRQRQRRQRRRRWRTTTTPRESHAARQHSPFSRWTCASARPRPWLGSPTTPERPACPSSAEVRTKHRHHHAPARSRGAETGSAHVYIQIIIN